MKSRTLAAALLTVAMLTLCGPSEARQHAPKCKVVDQYTWIDYWEKRDDSWIERTVTVTEKRCRGRGYSPREIVTSQVFGPWRPAD